MEPSGGRRSQHEARQRQPAVWLLLLWLLCFLQQLLSLLSVQLLDVVILAQRGAAQEQAVVSGQVAGQGETSEPNTHTHSNSHNAQTRVAISHSNIASARMCGGHSCSVRSQRVLARCVACSLACCCCELRCVLTWPWLCLPAACTPRACLLSSAPATGCARPPTAPGTSEGAAPRERHRTKTSRQETNAVEENDEARSERRRRTRMERTHT